MSYVHWLILAMWEEAQETASGKWLGDDFLGVALPSRGALYRRVVVNYGGKVIYAECRDIGPWCIDDDEYVFGEARPRAEIYVGKYCPVKKGGTGHATVPDGYGGWIAVHTSNGAGIDLFPATGVALGIRSNTNVQVDWSFSD